jgi:hypothetical protein
MTMRDTAPTPRLLLGILLWLAGTVGAATVTIGVLPPLSATMPLPGPLWLVMLAGIFQSAVLVALAVWGGTALAPAVGLRAPVFEAAATHGPIMAALKPQISGRPDPSWDDAAIPGDYVQAGGHQGSSQEAARLAECICAHDRRQCRDVAELGARASGTRWSRTRAAARGLQEPGGRCGSAPWLARRGLTAAAPDGGRC